MFKLTKSSFRPALGLLMLLIKLLIGIPAIIIVAFATKIMKKFGFRHKDADNLIFEHQKR